VAPVLHGQHTFPLVLGSLCFPCHGYGAPSASSVQQHACGAREDSVSQSRLPLVLPERASLHEFERRDACVAARGIRALSAVALAHVHTARVSLLVQHHQPCVHRVQLHALLLSNGTLLQSQVEQMLWGSGRVGEASSCVHLERSRSVHGGMELWYRGHVFELGVLGYVQVGGISALRRACSVCVCRVT
jgi:hypothetical protein